MALSKTTQDHDEIKAWAEARGGKPAEVASTETKDGPGIIRLEFPNATNANDSNLKEISWDDFFTKFDESGLALVYQDVTADGEQSNFNRLIHPENASPSSEKSESVKGSSATRPKSKSAAKKTVPVKASSKKSASGKVVAKKAAPGKAAEKTSSKAPAKSAAKKTAGAKAASPTAKKSGAKKSVVKAPAKKAAATKSTSSTAKKAVGKKAAAKKSPAKKR